MGNNYPINYLPSAEQDLSEIVEYIMIDNPSAAVNFLSRLDEKVSYLSQFPNSGTIPNDPRLKSLNYRMLVFDNYLVFYVFENDEIEIRRVLHGKRKYNFLL
jgi:toxin ParE1/3/4